MDEHFASLHIGKTLPVVSKQAITRSTLALFAGASNDDNPLHIDIDFARAAGLDDVIAHGMLIMAYLGQVLTVWVPQTRWHRGTPTPMKPKNGERRSMH